LTWLFCDQSINTLPGLIDLVILDTTSSGASRSHISATALANARVDA
jgi:hypothetical protein